MSIEQASSGTLVSEIQNEDMMELVAEFVADLPGRASAIESALEENQLDILASLAHQLKGAGGGYGFPTITDAAQIVELAAKRNETVSALKGPVDALADLCRRARARADES